MNADLQAMLMQLLAAKSGIDPETLTDPGGSTGDVDPRMSLLMNYFNQKQAPARDDDPDDEAEVEVLRPDPADLRMRQLRREIEYLRRRSDTLAAALGACYLCWGRDPACVQCLGAGHPGWNEPDELLFRRLVGPAIRRRRETHPPVTPSVRRAPGNEPNDRTRKDEP
jgi:hypothetical protein